MSKPAAVIILRHRAQFALVVASDHLLFGYLVRITGIGRGGAVFVLDPDGIEIAMRRRELHPLGRKVQER